MGFETNSYIRHFFKIDAPLGYPKFLNWFHYSDFYSTIFIRRRKQIRSPERRIVFTNFSGNVITPQCLLFLWCYLCWPSSTCSPASSSSPPAPSQSLKRRGSTSLSSAKNACYNNSKLSGACCSWAWWPCPSTTQHSPPSMPTQSSLFSSPSSSPLENLPRF